MEQFKPHSKSDSVTRHIQSKHSKEMAMKSEVVCWH